MTADPWDEPGRWEAGVPDAPGTKPDGGAAPTRFAPAFAELTDIAQRLKPSPGHVPDVDEIEPLVRRAQVLAEYCQARIDAVRALLDGQEPG